MKNAKIRVAMVECNMKQWQLARLMGIHESLLCRRLRDELPEEEQDKIVKLIKENAFVGGANVSAVHS